MKDSKTKIINRHTNEIGEICLRSDNILTFIPNKIAKSTNIEVMKGDLERFIDWTKKTGPLPFLSDNRTLKQMNSEERLYIQSKLPLFASKIAVLVKGGLSSYFFNLMSYLNKPEISMKSFTDADKALNWLKGN